jgi:hypothetical protein
MSFHTADRLARDYGVQETNSLPDGGHDWANFEDEPMTLGELQDAGGKVSRLRMLTDPGCPFLDVSYVQGVLPNGRNVTIHGLQVMSLRKGKGSVPYARDIIEWAKAEGVYAKGLGMLDQGVWSILR